MQEKIIILEIPFNNITLEEALEKTEALWDGDGQFQFATPNPEMLLEAQKNELFKKILQNSALNIPDGIGIIFASRWLKKPLKERVTGVDFMKKIIQKTGDPASPLYRKKIFLLGGAEGIAEKTAEKLIQYFPHTQIIGTHSGTPKIEHEKEIIKKINNSEAEVLFVAYGAPAQELWIARNLKKMPKIKIAMGVGGTFDFIAAVKKRAPEWMQKIGLEWLYRLMQEPRRIKRIYNAVIKFPIKIVLGSSNQIPEK